MDKDVREFLNAHLIRRVGNGYLIEYKGKEFVISDIELDVMALKAIKEQVLGEKKKS